VLEAAAKAETRGWEMLRKVAVDSLGQLEDGGMEVHEPDPALLGALQKVGETMTREWTEQSGADGAKLIEAYSAQ
jgi:TRAP-type C4-dicarboxylate transport system substrate-binding protein